MEKKLDRMISGDYHCDGDGFVIVMVVEANSWAVINAEDVVFNVPVDVSVTAKVHKENFYQ